MPVKIEKDNERKLPLRPQSAQQAGECPVAAEAVDRKRRERKRFAFSFSGLS